MKATMKRVLLVLAAVVLLLVGGLLATFGSVFGGLKATTDGQALPGGARRVLDGYTSAYVLPMGEKEVALVDCGDDPQAKTLKAELSRRGLGVEAVKAILVTHGHPDHIGGCKQFPAAQVYVGEGDLGLVGGTEAAKGPLPKLMGPASKLALQGVKGLTDGQVLELGTLKVRAFIIPGHTAGSAAFLASGALFMGDSLSINSDGSVRKAPWVFSDDSALNVASLLKLSKALSPEAAEVKAIVPAHSGSAEGFKALADYSGG